MRELDDIFSKFGLLFSIYVPADDKISTPIGYAFIKYYSRKSALTAVQSTDRKAVIGQTLLKVTA